MTEKQPLSVNLSKHMITHMNVELTSSLMDVEKLNLDQNSISKLENISHLKQLQQLSASHNCLIKISGLDELSNLTVLNLAENSICSIESVQTLTQLVWLNLSGNNIRSMTGLENNLALKHIDLSDNTITCLSDLSHLYTLKTLLLHGNILRSLHDAHKLLPKNLNILSLAENEITELHQVRNLSQLKKLEQLSLMNNPCVSYQQFTHYNNTYRAYVLSWACNLDVLDGQHITVPERQNASELLSNGYAHRFGSGEQSKLVMYLTTIKFTSAADVKQAEKEIINKQERPSTSGGRENKMVDRHSSAVRRVKSDERLDRTLANQYPPAYISEHSDDTASNVSPTKSVKAWNRSKQPTTDSPASPLAVRKDMQGLRRQVIGQERSPGASTALTIPKQSAALPKMSRSRSGSRSPNRNEQKPPASRKLILVSSSEKIDQSGVYATELVDVPFTQPASQTDVASIPTQTESDAGDYYSKPHHQAAVRIQAIWRGYKARNLDERVLKIKQEIRCQRLEETVAFLLSEMNRQQQINMEGQKVRNCLILSIEHLTSKLEEITSNTFLDPSAV